MRDCSATPFPLRLLYRHLIDLASNRKGRSEATSRIIKLLCFRTLDGKSRRMTPALFYLFFAIILMSYGHTAVAQSSMNRLTQQHGWVLSGHLFWTADQGAHWKDISPTSNLKSPTIRSVHFVDTAHAFAMTSSWDHAAHLRRFEVSSTSDAGANWSTVSLTPESFIGPSGSLTGSGSIDFVDALHGWLNLNVNSSANFARGLLLMTIDGGKTWTAPRSSPGIAGMVRFTTRLDGWIAGGPGGQKLFVTHDGARSWEKVTVPTPAELFSATGATFGLPVFDTPLHGFLPVTFARQQKLGSALTLYETKDGGKSWARNRVHSSVGKSTTIPSAVLKSGLITGKISGKSQITLATVTEGDNVQTVTGDLPAATSGLVGGQLGEPSFIDAAHGWIRQGDHIFSTSDGGHSWSDITPQLALPLQPAAVPDTVKQGTVVPFTLRAPRYSQQYPPPNPSSKSRQLALGAVHADDLPLSPVATGLPTNGLLGFDLCAAPDADTMQSWWNTSPFFVAGIYIGGNNQSCSQPNLDGTWVAQVNAQGWGLMPVWAGSQPSCSCQVGSETCVPFNNTINTDPAAAAAQGTAEAGTAITAASNLGLSGIIYLDMSSYDVASCGASVSQFINNWVSGVHAGGFQAGLYGTPVDQLTISSLDAVWVADPDGEATIDGLSPLPDSSYPVGQRAHQYVQGVDTAWGDVTLNSVDTTLVASPIVPGDPSQIKPYDFNYMSVDYPGASGTALTGINNMHNSSSLSQAQIGTMVGYYTDATTGLEGSFLYDGTTYTPIYVPGSLSTTASAINDQGTVVGTYLLPIPGEGGGIRTGFSYSGGTYTTIIPPGEVLQNVSRFIDITAINDSGIAVGEYSINEPPGIQGFSYDTNNGTFTPLNSPGGVWSIAWGINGFNQIMGWSFESSTSPAPWVLDSGAYTFLASPPIFPAQYSLNNNGQATGGGFFAGPNFFTNIGYPDAVGTSTVSALNDASQMVGNYTSADSATHGFVAVANSFGTGGGGGTLEVRKVTYTNTLPIWQDSPSNATPTAISKDVWTVGTTAPTVLPSAFPSNTKIQATVVFKSFPAVHPDFTNVHLEGKITGDGMAGCGTNMGTFTTPNFTIGSTTTYSVDLTSDLLPKRTAHCSRLQVDWLVSYSGLSCSAVPAPCVSAGTTYSEVYVTLASPVAQNNTVFQNNGFIPLTALVLAVGDGGATDQKSAFLNTWNKFQGPADVTSWDASRPLYYYKANTPDSDCAIDERDLLTRDTGSGECESWADLFRDVLSINGIASTFVHVKARDSRWMLIKDWTFDKQSNPGSAFWLLQLDNEKGGTPGMVPNPLPDPPVRQMTFGELTSGPGIRGQNSSPPSEKVFTDHYIVKVSLEGIGANQYFDPSYGVSYLNDCAFETQSVDGYASYQNFDIFAAQKKSTTCNIKFTEE